VELPINSNDALLRIGWKLKEWEGEKVEQTNGIY